MFEWLKTYLIGILWSLLAVSLVTNGVQWWYSKGKQEEINNLNVQLGIVSGLSTQQEVKIVESQKIEEKLKVVTQDKIHVITEYVYDENKSDCDNAAIMLDGTF